MRGLAGLFAAEIVSGIGSRMSAIALPWFVLATTGSTTRAGVVAFAEMLPYVLACALGGPLIDRAGPRRTAIGADVVSAAVVVAIPLLHHHGLNFAVLVALVAAAGAQRGLGDIAKRACFPALVARSGVDLTRAASLHDGLGRLATLLGAPAGGVLIAVLDAPAVLVVDAATFLVAGLIIAAAVRMPPVPRDREPYLVALRSGAAVLRRDRLAAAIMLMLLGTNLFDAAYTSVLLPAWAKLVAGSPVVAGTLSAAFGIGAVLGNVVFTATAPRAPRYALFTLAFLIAGGPRFLATALTDTMPTLYAVSFTAGLAIAAVNPILGAVLYERIPAHLTARVQGLATSVSWLGIPIGGLAGGWLATTVGLRPTLAAFGVAYLAVACAPLIWPATWRGLDRTPAGSLAGRTPG